MPEVDCNECGGPIGPPALEGYYHGYIDRNEAERRLKGKGIPNSYLLRLSRTLLDDDKWEPIYVLSYLSSTLQCYHFKLIPRLNCFQLGGRLFDCLQGCLSRYYVHDIMTGERLRHPVPPCSPPVELYTQRLRAIQAYEPSSSNDQLGCSVGDRFLLISDDSKSDWIFATSLKTRHSGYLPRCCVEKEYPPLIERLDFFHPDVSQASTKQMLKRAGAHSYLLRPSDSRPGLYTLLLYDGARVRKYRLELVVQSEETPCFNTPVGSQGDDSNLTVCRRRCSEPISLPTPDSDTKNDLDGSGDELCPTDPRRRSDDMPVHQTATDILPDCSLSQKDSVLPNYSTTTRVIYNGIPFPSVESVVAAIEAYPGPWNPASSSLNEANEDGCDGSMNGLQVSNGTDLCSGLSDASGPAESRLPRTTTTSSLVPHLFKPVRRELKPHLNTSSPPIYMVLRYAQQPPTDTGVLEIHGEMSILIAQRKKWKSHYAQLDRRQGILTLRDGEKRKTERFDLSKCDYYPVHSLMYDRAFCFGLILYGASLGDKEEIVFSVDTPMLQLCPTCLGSPASGGPNNNIYSRSPPAFGPNELDPSTYAGRPEEFLSSIPLPIFGQPGRAQSLGDLSIHSNNNTGSSDASPTTSCPHIRAVSQEVVYDRWLRCIRLHCRNTRVDACNEVDCDRRQTVLRCHRTLEVKVNNAKLLPAGACKSRRDESIYVISLDGIEIARAYPGSSTVHILLDDFPFGFKKVEVWAKEENKRKRFVAVDLELSQFNSALSQSIDSNQSNLNHAASDTHAHFGTLQSNSSSICTVREGVCNQGAITYKELHVLPFAHYERFREIMRTYLDSELVPLCIFVWQNLPNESSSRTSFLSSLLLTTIELKCHLQLVLSLLRADIMPQNPTDAFRGNTLGTQILDQYSNIVCTEWRNQCFRRVRKEALNGVPSSTSSTGSSLVKSLSGLSIDRLPTGPCVPKTLGLACRPVVPSAVGLPYSLSNNVMSTDSTSSFTDQSNQIRPPVTVTSPISSQLQHTPSAQIHHPSVQTAEQEWHSHLVSIVVDDLVNHVRYFPLQVRWVYSELQAQQADQTNNSVIRNLVFLRGICPCLLPTSGTGRGSILTSFSSGGIGSAGGVGVGCTSSTNFQMYPNFNSSITSGSPECTTGGTLPSSPPTVGSSQVANDALVTVAKTLVSLVNATVSTKGVLSPEQFLAYHHRLFHQFRIPITAPLNADELRQLDQLCEREACIASRRSLSRELALLANYFLEALGSRVSSETNDANVQSNLVGREHRLSGDCALPPRVPNLLNALYDLEHRTRLFLKHPPKTGPMCFVQN